MPINTVFSQQQDNPDYKLNLGAKLYLDKFITPQQRFQAIIKSSYYSDVETVDFSKPEETAAIINAWCSNSTKNLITNIVNPGIRNCTESVFLTNNNKIPRFA